ncbi:alkaline phosphatase D family protein [Litorimonas sp. RW-G-Af-16]|uniref:alkaline phosphatase D family protein n=1 Tax=Litorimonas sp. RW-G-Af-16 TaxID=3241168 RepID=UPI00390C5762
MFNTRRDILTGLSALSLGACATTPLGSVERAGVGQATNGGGDLFTLGVASGDPVSDGFVLWTRLAPLPLQANGGMQEPTRVAWQVAEDERFSRVIRAGETVATSEWAHSVHIEVSGLQPLRPYFYRFIANGQTSPVGRAKTAPTFGSSVASLRMGIATCQHFEQGFFNCYNDMVAQDPDLVLHMGDYIYEASWGPQVRRQASAEAVTLADYRIIHAQYKTDKALQAAHAAAPWIMIWDDHEVVNDYAGLNDENYMPREEFRARRNAAYKAYYEHMPVRLRSKPHGDHMRLYDYFHYGNLATIALTDGRQYRDDQACQTPDDGGAQMVNCPELNDPTRSMFGKEQERWLMPSFARSGATWEMLAQPTLFSRLNQTNRAGEAASWSDGWDGYPATRQMLLDAVAQRKPKNFVSLGGDMHSWWQADLKLDYDDMNSQTVGTEFVTTSTTAHSYAYGRFSRMLPNNPHIHFFDDRARGYTLIDLTPERMTVKFQEVDNVYSPTAPTKTRKTYVVESGVPKANEV